MQLKIWPVVEIICISLLCLGDAQAKGAAIQLGNYSKVYYGPKGSLNIVRDDSSAISFSDRKQSLTLLQDSTFRTYVLRKEILGHRYEIYLKENKANRFRKVGIIKQNSHYFFSDKCSTDSSIEKLHLEVKKLSEFVLSEPLQGRTLIDKSCSDQVRGIEKKIFVDRIEQQLSPSENYLLNCLSNPTAIEKLKKISALKDSLPNVVAKLSNDFASLKAGHPTFKVSCQNQDEKRPFNAKYNSETNTFIFPTKEQKADISSCLGQDAAFTHEYLHRGGMTNEKQVQIVEAICASANGLEGFSDKSCESQFSMKKCVEKPESCNQMGVAAALKQAVNKEAKAEQAKVMPALQQEIAAVQLEDVQMAESADISNLQAVSRGDAPVVATSTDLSPAVQGVAAAMQRNMNRLSTAVDAAFAVSANQAVAATTSTATGRSSTRRTVANASAEEYVAEEIIADKFNIPVDQVRRVAKAEIDADRAEKAALAGGLAQSAGPGSEIAGGGTDALPAADVAGTRSAASANPSKSQQRKVASISSGTAQADAVLQLSNKTEVLGADYQKIRTQYSKGEFVEGIRAENVRIILAKERRRIGSTKSDAIIFVDTGSSLIRKR